MSKILVTIFCPKCHFQITVLEKLFAHFNHYCPRCKECKISEFEIIQYHERN
jgi:hypothetical protein